MKKFLFQITQQYLRVVDVKNIGPVYLEVEYSIVDGKVVVLDVTIPYPILAYLQNTYSLHDQIYHAAENNALSEKLLPLKEAV